MGSAPAFDPDQHPPTPQELFREWFHSAESVGVHEPHAMSVSTIDADGMPDSRMLVLKDLTAEGAWCFAGRRDSTKGVQLGAHPVAALLFYWREQVRSVRIRGRIVEGSTDESRADFLARHPEARAVALSGRQGALVTTPSDLARDVDTAAELVAADPALAPEEWVVWRLDPTEVEFWQGAETRLHTRLRYRRSASGWDTTRHRP